MAELSYRICLVPYYFTFLRIRSKGASISAEGTRVIRWFIHFFAPNLACSFHHEGVTNWCHGCWSVPHLHPVPPYETHKRIHTAGLGILRSLLTDNGISQVTYLGRRPLPPWVVLPGGTSTDGASPTHPKLITIEHKDFLTYPPAIQETIAQHDACIWALGISAVGMSEAKYTEITVGYLDSFLNVLEEKAAGTDGSPFRVVFVSGKGTDSTEKTRNLFARVKVRVHADTQPFVELTSRGSSRGVLKTI